MPFKRTYTDEQFLQAVKDSTYMTDLLRKLGLTDGSRKSVKKVIDQLNPDTSHWIDINLLKQKNFKTGLIEIPIEDVLVENSKYVYSDLKKKLLKHKILEYKCYSCPLTTEWNGKPLTLQLDHINGKHNDNRVENLRLLCPNCHSQTETFCGKLGKTKLPKCNYCDNKVKDKRSKTCKSCYLSQDYRTISWPKNEYLIGLLTKNTYSKAAEVLGINESTLRRRLKNKQLINHLPKSKNSPISNREKKFKEFWDEKQVDMLDCYFVEGIDEGTIKVAAVLSMNNTETTIHMDLGAYWTINPKTARLRTDLNLTREFVMDSALAHDDKELKNYLGIVIVEDYARLLSTMHHISD